MQPSSRLDRYLPRVAALTAAVAVATIVGLWSYWHLPTSRLIVDGASPIQQALLDASLADYTAAGLEMPPLRVVFRDNCVGMDGADGITARTFTHVVIDICRQPGPHVMSHELAHAWLDTHLARTAKNTYTTTVGLPTWGSHRYPWHERAGELAAEELSWGVSRLAVTELNVTTDWATLAFGYTQLLAADGLTVDPPVVDRHGTPYAALPELFDIHPADPARKT